MQKKIIALAVVGSLAAAPAFAQTNVQIYGSIDMGFSHRGDNVASNVGSKNAIDSGLTAGNRLGFKGTEDLGNGLKALFTLEAGFMGDTGTQAQGGRLFGRQAAVGLAGGYATLLAGRLYTPHYSFLVALDPFQGGMLGNYQNTHNAGTMRYLKEGDGETDGLGENLFDPIRVDNAVAYVSPTWLGGFNVTAAYSSNAYGQEHTENRHDNRVIAILPRYTNGPIDLGLSWHQIKDNDKPKPGEGSVGGLNKPKITNWAVGGSYDFGELGGGLGLKLSAFYDSNKLTASSGGAGADLAHDLKMKSWMVGAAMPLGKHTFLVSYNRSKLENDPYVGDGDSDYTVRQWALGYKYNLSKRTNLFAAYANISQDSGLEHAEINGSRKFAAGVGDNSNAGDGYQNGFQFGIRHTF
jgi:predicted porin